MIDIYKKGIMTADDIRSELELNMFQPVNIFDACIRLGLSVRFVDINMEGVYINRQGGVNPTILLSNQRPLPRRCFTCAHELGHHIFKHGSKIDALSNGDYNGSNEMEEFLVDSFAGALLMPVAGIQAEFKKRNWVISKASPIDFYTISCVFGTGYQTLVMNCKMNHLINEIKSIELLKFTPAKILKSIFTSSINTSYFKIIDRHSSLTLIDLEVSNYIVLPPDIRIEGDHLKKYKESNIGICNVAVKPGIVRAATVDNRCSYFIRTQNFQYIGLAENRHLETLID